METIYIILITIWLLLGIIAVWRTYYGDIKSWYFKFNCDLRKDYDYNGHLKLLLIGSPIFIIGGLFSLIMMEVSNSTNTWYFKIPK
jgi:hypothetical protein